MKQNGILITVIVAVIVGAVAFYGGMQYQKQRMVAAGVAGAFGRGQGGQAGANAGRRFGGQNGATPVRGQIISSDSKSITVKLMDGSSKIVLLSNTTAISQAATATTTDLQTGKEVMVFGTANSDGSVTAQNIQLNPQQMRQGQPNPTGAK